MMFPLPSAGLKVGEFGDKFRKAREKKELSLDDVSNVTKIGARMLQAIEEEHFDQLPGGVFNKGFIRAYSKHLGLNEREAVTDYLACLRQAQIDAHEVWEPERPPQAPPAVPKKRPQVEPNKPAVKSQSSVQVEELPELQLPRAEHVRPPRKNFAVKSDREVPWSILAIAAVVIVLGVILWTRPPHNPSAAAATSSPLKPSQSASAAVTTSTPVPRNQPSLSQPLHQLHKPLTVATTLQANQR